ncbi:MAG: alpha/beta hydrolase [Actinomycetota bacterium]|nr:alpha/beta hydrolase [Actinomycetota bacterium]
MLVNHVGLSRVLVSFAIVAGSALAIAAVLAALLWWRQERIVFQPSGPPYPDGGAARRVEYRASDGQPLFAYVVGDEVAAAATGVLLAFHGNADLAAWVVPWGREVQRRTGRVVVLAEYRGYGGLTGPPTVEGVRRDAQAAFAWVRDTLRVPNDRLAIYGHSLGSAVAAELAAEARPAALLLEAPFTSARAMARIVVARPVELVWGVISRVRYDTEASVRRLDARVSVAHGESDFIIPSRMGEAVFAAARLKGELLIVPGAGHNDLAEVAGESYWRWIEAGSR